jgi:putative membrane protein
MKNRRWFWGVVTAASLALGGWAFAQGPDNPSRTGPGTSGSAPGTDQYGNMPSPGAPSSPSTRMGKLNDQNPSGVIDDVNSPAPAAAPPAAAATPSGDTANGMGSANAANAASDDAHLVAKLHQVNQMEITVGKLAENQAQSKAARDFGAKLVRDHQVADKKLMSYADKTGIDANAMPQAGSDEDAQMQEKVDHLRNLTGADFDREFATMMSDGHRQVIDEVTSAKSTVTDPKLKSLLGQLLPTLQKHYQTAQSLVSKTQNVSSDQETGTTPKSVQGRHGSGSTH